MHTLLTSSDFTQSGVFMSDIEVDLITVAVICIFPSIYE